MNNDPIPERPLFRDAMSRLGAAVSLITTRAADGPHGITVSSVCSVTDDPPTVLFCMNNASQHRDAFGESVACCINMLGPAQKDLAGVFTNAARRSMDECFAQGSWATLVSGAPRLVGAPTVLDTVIDRSVRLGSHTVFFCRVHAIHLERDPASLIYFKRAYHAIPHGDAGSHDDQPSACLNARTP